MVGRTGIEPAPAFDTPMRAVLCLGQTCDGHDSSSLKHVGGAHSIVHITALVAGETPVRNIHVFTVDVEADELVSEPLRSKKRGSRTTERVYDDMFAELFRNDAYGSEHDLQRHLAWVRRFSLLTFFTCWIFHQS